MASVHKLLDGLIQAAYDSGYHSGKGEDGQPHHKMAIEKREEYRRIITFLLGPEPNLAPVKV